MGKKKKKKSKGGSPTRGDANGAPAARGGKAPAAGGVGKRVFPTKARKVCVGKKNAAGSLLL